MTASARRSFWKLAMIPANPWPSLPRRFSAGTRQSTKERSAVSEAFQPIFRIFLVTEKPGVALSIISRLTPL